jgi:3-methyladenine DNA glycosylase AlkD
LPRRYDTTLLALSSRVGARYRAADGVLRKAIGWALREHAWTDSREVVRYVRANAAALSPLSKREALKNVVKQGLVKSVP